MTCVPRLLRARNRRAGTPFTPEELEDLSQEALGALWRKLGRYDGSASLETWAFRFCELEFLHGLRAKGRGRLVLEETLEGTPLEPRSAGGVEPADHEHLFRSLEALDSEVAVVVRLKHYEDLTFEVIGERLGCSANTAKTRYYRGLRKLKQALGANSSRKAEPERGTGSAGRPGRTGPTATTRLAESEREPETR